MSNRPLVPGRRTVLRGSLLASAAVAVPVTAAAAPAFARSGLAERVLGCAGR